MDTYSNQNIDISGSWPENGLELVEVCPVCESKERVKLYEGLKDRIFWCAPGEWTLWKCLGCGSAYLNPRPNKESIYLAYTSYSTHESSYSKPLAELGLWRYFRRSTANGYRNFMHKTNLHPSSFLGIALAFFPSQRNKIDWRFCNLDKNFPSGQKLLDVGCGNGDFLYFAKSTGRDVIGVDMDPKAVLVAQNKGLNVKLGGVDVLNPDEEEFDIITLGHVIEHVHNPVNLLRQCYRLLKKNGYIWIDTPNIESEGHRIYGINWTLLDPPRHLALFSYNSLRKILEDVGFSNIQDQPYRPLCKDIYPTSEAISKGKEDAINIKIKSSSDLCKKNIKRAGKIERENPNVRECITIKAWKID
jgi:2-polyprenyl-3-methyl-5-hydroxy-6-metoxy-1,4-benzoquinol methylase